MTYSLPAARSVDWAHAGVEGGIPTVTTIGVNVRGLGAVGDGVADDTGAFERAINLTGTWSAATPKQIYIPAGTYKITRQLYPKSGQVFHGDGSNVTKLMFTFGTDPNWKHCFHIAGSAGTTYAISSGANKDSDEIVVSNGAAFSIGDTIELYQQNDLSWWWTGTNSSNGQMKCKGSWGTAEKPDMYAAHTGWAREAKGELAKVSGKSGNTLTLDHALFTTLDSAKSPVARVVTPATQIGIEYLYVHADAQGAHQSASWGFFFFFTYATNCWVRGVDAHMARQHWWGSERSAHLELRQSWFHEFNDPTWTGEGYLVDLRQHCTSCLIEDNSYDGGALGFTPSIGSCGNVFAYNYVNTHKTGVLPESWGWYDIETHGWQSHHNLFEGNFVWGATCSATWGPTPYHVFFRNRIRKVIWILDISDYCSIIGNEIWDVISNGINKGPSSPNIGSVSGWFVHGNEVGSQVTWDANTADHVLPASFVYTSKPSWWDSACAWPPIGPDVAYDMIPAQFRYNNCSKVPQS